MALVYFREFSNMNVRIWGGAPWCPYRRPWRPSPLVRVFITAKLTWQLARPTCLQSSLTSSVDLKKLYINMFLALLHADPKKWPQVSHAACSRQQKYICPLAYFLIQLDTYNRQRFWLILEKERTFKSARVNFSE